MKQSASSKHMEALTNQIVGVFIGWSVVFWIFTHMGMETTAHQATASSALFFVFSYARHFAIRTLFDRLQKRH